MMYEQIVHIFHLRSQLNIIITIIILLLCMQQQVHTVKICICQKTSPKPKELAVSEEKLKSYTKGQFNKNNMMST